MGVVPFNATTNRHFLSKSIQIEISAIVKDSITSYLKKKAEIFSFGISKTKAPLLNTLCNNESSRAINTPIVHEIRSKTSGFDSIC